VTRLGGAAKGDAPPSQKVLRVSFSISETGECSLRLEPASPMAGGTSLTEQDDGIWRCQHDFTKSSDIELFEGPYCRAVNVRVDQARKLLMFEAAPAEGFEREASQAIYQCRFRVPLQVSLDLVITGRRYMFQLNPMPAGQQGLKQAVISISSNDAPSGETTVEVASMSRDLGGKAIFEQPIVKRQVIRLDEPWEKSFRLPVPNVRSKDIYMLGLGTVGESVLGVASLTLSGIPAPSLGMRLGEKSGMIFVEAVTPGSLAERTGIKAGDVLLSIREKHPANMTEAVDLLADMPLNERSEMSFQRANTKRTFVLTPTFGK